MTQSLTFVCDLSITIYNAMGNKNEMKSTLTEEFKAKGIQFLLFFGNANGKTEYMLFDAFSRPYIERWSLQQT